MRNTLLKPRLQQCPCRNLTTPCRTPAFPPLSRHSLFVAWLPSSPSWRRLHESVAVAAACLDGDVGLNTDESCGVANDGQTAVDTPETIAARRARERRWPAKRRHTRIPHASLQRPMRIDDLLPARDIASLAAMRADVMLSTLPPSRLARYVSSMSAKDRQHLRVDDIIDLFSQDKLDVHVLRTLFTYDCNKAVRALCARGDIERARALATHLHRCRKANQHTCASFIDGAVEHGDFDAACSAFETWLEDGVAVGAASVSAMLKAHADERGVHSSHAQFKAFAARGLELNSVCYMQQMFALAHVGAVDDAINVVRMLRASHGSESVDALCYQAALKAVDRRRAHKRAAEVWQHMIDNDDEHVLDVKLASRFIHCAAQCGNVSLLHRVVAAMRRRDLRPNLITFNSMLQTYATAADWRGCCELFDEMAAMRDVRVDSYTCTAMLTAASRTRQTVPTVEQLWRRFMALGVACNSEMYTSRLTALRYADDDHVLRTTTCNEVMHEMTTNGVTRVAASYNIMMSLAAEANDIIAALRWFRRMQDDEVVPNAKSIDIMISACTENGLIDRAQSFRDLGVTLRILKSK